ncbi:MAG: hypothetical protein M5U09_22130 [Gammaproteobacteria bacterium]|nr:hypothetical protein [Gammaproteobacteria bacterium]
MRRAARTVPTFCLAILTSLVARSRRGAEGHHHGGAARRSRGLRGRGYYTPRDHQGLAFSALDIGLIAGLAASDEDGLQWGLGAGLLASHVWQGFDAAAAAGRDNRRHLLPCGVDLSPAGLGSWDSGRASRLFAMGGASRDLAAAYRSRAAARPAFNLHLGFADRAVGVRYQADF